MMTKVMTQLTNDDDKGDDEFDGHDDVDDDGHLAPKSRGETLPCFPHWPQKVLQGKLEILVTIAIKIRRTKMTTMIARKKRR